MNKYYGLKPGTITSEELEHTQIVREVAARGMVLMENDGVLPLKQGTKIALYGSGAKNTEFSGIGAASFTSREEISIMEGLKRSGIVITSTAYLDQYAKLVQEQEDNYYSEIRKYMSESLIRSDGDVWKSFDLMRPADYYGRRSEKVPRSRYSSICCVTNFWRRC